MNVLTIGICCNEKSKFKEICQYNIILPFQNELEINNLKSIPTNSIMSHLLFCNLLTIGLIDKLRITIEKYKENHPAGNIGNSLKTLKECIIRDFPKIFLHHDTKKIKLNLIFIRND